MGKKKPSLRIPVKINKIVLFQLLLEDTGPKTSEKQPATIKKHYLAQVVK